MRKLVLCLLVLLVACKSEQSDADAPLPDTTDNCGAAEYQYLVGHDARELDAMTFGSPTRILPPGLSVTMEFSPDRLNFYLDENRKIVDVRCG